MIPREKIVPIRARDAIREIGRRAFRLPMGYTWQPAPSVLLQRFQFTVGGQHYVVESDHRTPIYETIMEIVDHDCYQLGAIGPAPRGSCIVDVGANIGIAAMALHGRFGVPVYSFEPMQDNVTQLRANLAVNGLADVHVIPQAIGRHTGSVDADVTWEASVSARASADFKPADGAVMQSIAMVSLRDALALVPADVFLMKLDCEGAEFEIVDQLDRELAGRIRNLTFEVHDQGQAHNVATLRAQLEGLGYEISVKPEMRGRSWLSHLLASRK